MSFSSPLSLKELCYFHLRLYEQFTIILGYRVYHIWHSLYFCCNGYLYNYVVMLIFYFLKPCILNGKHYYHQGSNRFFGLGGGVVGGKPITMVCGLQSSTLLNSLSFKGGYEIFASHFE
jgi:hypothetical protein